MWLLLMSRFFSLFKYISLKPFDVLFLSESVLSSKVLVLFDRVPTWLKELIPTIDKNHYYSFWGIWEHFGWHCKLSHFNFMLPESYSWSVVELGPLAPILRLAERVFVFSDIIMDPSIDCLLLLTGKFKSIFGTLAGCLFSGIRLSRVWCTCSLFVPLLCLRSSLIDLVEMIDDAEFDRRCLFI